MKVGDLVNVTQTLGCYDPPRHFRERGVGIVLDISKCNPLNFKGIGEVRLGDNIKIALATGEVTVFDEKSVKVLSESR